nr:stage II sporulation protein M [Staphylococcus agnetis]
MGIYTNQCILCPFTDVYIGINSHTFFILNKPYSFYNYTRCDDWFLLYFDSYKGVTPLLAYIQHYTFEIMGLCVIASGLYSLNQIIIRKISNLFRKRKKEEYSLKLSIINLGKMYLLVFIPLIILAAFTETYIATFLLNLLK